MCPSSACSFKMNHDQLISLVCVYNNFDIFSVKIIACEDIKSAQWKNSLSHTL